MDFDRINEVRQEDIALEKKRQAIFQRKVRELMDTAQGRSFVWEVLSFCGLYNMGQCPSELLQFREGRKSVGVYILELLNDADPSIYPRLILENLEESK